MRLAKYVGLAALMIASAAGVTEAGPVTFSDIYNPTDVRFEKAGAIDLHCGGNTQLDTVSAVLCETLTFTHILQPPAGADPYDPLLHLLASATLEIDVYDDGDTQTETLNYYLDSILLGGFFPVPPTTIDGNTSGNPFTHPFNVLAQITPDGELVVKLEAKAGDLMFAESRLNASGREVELTPTATELPEPGTLALLGFAAVAAGLRRKTLI
jgi:hypothetical protein